MAGDPVSELLALASAPLGAEHADAAIALDGPLGSDLRAMLRRANGFYAFESALHVFPSGATGMVGLEVWNASELWRSEYDGLADDLVFFAEDVFGGQFVLSPEGVGTFDPETGDVALLAEDLQGWAAVVLDDRDVLTGYPLAHEWQAQHGALPSGQRLLPRVPFVLGGDFAVSNLYCAGAVDGMRTRANLATQLRDLPDGATVTYRIIE